MSTKAKRAFLFTGVLTGLVAACLGFETRSNNHLGWALFLAGLLFSVVGVIYMGAQSRQKPGSPSEPDFSIWPIAFGVLMVSFIPALEYLFLSPILYRGDWMQDVGLALFASGVPLFLWSWFMLGWRKPASRQAASAPRSSGAETRRLLRYPLYASLALLALGMSIGYSSLFGLLAVLFLLLPGVIYQLNLSNRFSRGSGS